MIVPFMAATQWSRRVMLGVQSNTHISPSETVTYRITAAELDSIAVQGSGDLTANAIDTDDLSNPGSGENEGYPRRGPRCG